jgi:predicted amidohydrolase
VRELVVAAVAAAFGGDVDASFRTIERALGEARVCGARLVVLPHGALPSLDDEGSALERLAALAGDLTVCAGIAPGERAAGDAVAACVSGDGLLGRQRRVALLADGRLAPGARLGAFDTPVGRVGMLVCDDKRLPGAARALALDGAEILAFLSAWPCSGADADGCLQDDSEWRLSELWDRARAAENQVLVAAANQSGSRGATRFLAGARIVGPDGDPLAATGTGCGIALARLDLRGVLARARRAMAPLRDRRPDVYRLAAALPA